MSKQKRREKYRIDRTVQRACINIKLLCRLSIETGKRTWTKLPGCRNVYLNQKIIIKRKCTEAPN